MRKAQNYQWKELSLGTCYYPEHWDRNLWKEDLDRMLANGIHTIRIGEFAWSKVEPREGEFTFAFFDDFLEVVAQTEMKVIFGTPTATPPVSEPAPFYTLSQSESQYFLPFYYIPYRSSQSHPE